MEYNLFFYFFIFILGLAVGSFLNCLIFRLEINKDFLRGRSFCPKCQHQLTWYDLLPALSFLILKGKCRYCHQKISWQYPLIELATATSFLLIFIFNIQYSIFYILISCFLIIIFVYDFKHYIIPDRIIYPAITIAFLYRLFETLEFRVWDLFRISDFGFRIFNSLVNPLLSAILASIFFLLIVLASQGRWMGIGDVKLAFLMGLILGFPEIVAALFLAFFIGAIIGLGLILSGKKTLKSEIPFGPFLITGTFIGLFWGEKIINFYLDLMKP